MYQATTPTIQCIFCEHDMAILDASQDNIYFTISQGHVVLTKDKDSIQIEDNILTVTLTQQNTLMFKPGPAKIQVRGKLPNGTAWASIEVQTQIEEILYKKVI